MLYNLLKNFLTFNQWCGAESQDGAPEFNLPANHKQGKMVDKLN